MSRFFRGLAAGVSETAGKIEDSIIEERRQNALLRLKEKFDIAAEGRAETAAIAGEGRRTKAEQAVYDRNKTDAEALRGKVRAESVTDLDKEIGSREKIAQIGADSRLDAVEARIAAGVGGGGGGKGKDKDGYKVIYEDVIDANGNASGKRPAWVEGQDSDGNTVVLPYDKYQAAMNAMNGAQPAQPPPPPVAAAPAAAPPPLPAGGAISQAKAAAANPAPALPPPPTMRRGQLIAPEPEEIVKRRGQVIPR